MIGNNNQPKQNIPKFNNPSNPVLRDYEWLKNNEDEFEKLSPHDQKVILGNT